MIHPALTTSASLMLCLLTLGAHLVAREPERTPDAFDTLAYRKTDGTTAIAKSVDEWQARRAAILQGAQSIMGPLPGEAKRCALDIRIEEEADCGSYVRHLITYASEPGSRTPAYLCIPKLSLIHI